MSDGVLKSLLLAHGRGDGQFKVTTKAGFWMQHAALHTWRS